MPSELVCQRQISFVKEHIPVLYAVAYNADPELSKTFAVADIYANVQGDSTYTRDEIACPWNAKLSILNSGGLTITFRD